MSRLWRTFAPNFMTAIEQSAKNVFGNMPVVNHRTGFKILARKPVGPLAMNHYNVDIERPFRNILKGYKTEIEQRRTISLARLKRKGKGPPKKGHGRRQAKKKK